MNSMHPSAICACSYRPPVRLHIHTVIDVAHLPNVVRLYQGCAGVFCRPMLISHVDNVLTHAPDTTFSDPNKPAVHCATNLPWQSSGLKKFIFFHDVRISVLQQATAAFTACFVPCAYKSRYTHIYAGIWSNRLLHLSLALLGTAAHNATSFLLSVTQQQQQQQLFSPSALLPVTDALWCITMLTPALHTAPTT